MAGPNLKTLPPNRAVRQHRRAAGRSSGPPSPAAAVTAQSLARRSVCCRTVPPNRPGALPACCSRGSAVPPHRAVVSGRRSVPTHFAGTLCCRAVTQSRSPHRRRAAAPGRHFVPKKKHAAALHRGAAPSRPAKPGRPFRATAPYAAAPGCRVNGAIAPGRRIVLPGQGATPGCRDKRPPHRGRGRGGPIGARPTRDGGGSSLARQRVCGRAPRAAAQSPRRLVGLGAVDARGAWGERRYGGAARNAARARTGPHARCPHPAARSERPGPVRPATGSEPVAPARRRRRMRSVATPHDRASDRSCPSDRWRGACLPPCGASGYLGPGRPGGSKSPRPTPSPGPVAESDSESSAQAHFAVTVIYVGLRVRSKTCNASEWTVRSDVSTI